MGVLHDYICNKCGSIFIDYIYPPQCCGEECSITYAYWRKLGVGSGDEHFKDGYLNKAWASDDPLCKIELGLQDKIGDSRYRTFSKEQAAYYREKMRRDGDSHKLRKEILDAREENIKRRNSR